jgi:hypothetical protein
MLRVLIACEFSGTVRDAFAARGHDAWSCDILPTERPGQHIVGDVLDVIGGGWDLMVAHPPCTYLANSGAKHLYLGMKKEGGPCPDRWARMREGAAFFHPTQIVEGREARVHKMAPSPDRWKERSRTFPGIAAAMAEQWG